MPLYNMFFLYLIETFCIVNKVPVILKYAKDSDLIETFCIVNGTKLEASFDLTVI